MKIRKLINRRARCHNKTSGRGANSMTENQFLEEMSFYQRRFERLHRAIIKDMKQYIHKNPAYDSAFYKTVESFSADITITGEWVKLLRSYNPSKYKYFLRFSNEFNINNGVPDKVSLLTDAKKNQHGSCKTDVQICQ